jgi:hypothetical protein
MPEQNPSKRLNPIDIVIIHFYDVWRRPGSDRSDRATALWRWSGLPSTCRLTIIRSLNCVVV